MSAPDLGGKIGFAFGMDVVVAPDAIIEAARRCGKLLHQAGGYDFYQWDRDIFVCPTEAGDDD